MQLRGVCYRRQFGGILASGSATEPRARSREPGRNSSLYGKVWTSNHCWEACVLAYVHMVQNCQIKLQSPAFLVHQVSSCQPKGCMDLLRFPRTTFDGASGFLCPSLWPEPSGIRHLLAGSYLQSSTKNRVRIRLVAHSASRTVSPLLRAWLRCFH